MYRALQFAAFQEEAEEADVEAETHGPTWPDMARFPCHFSSFCEAKAKWSGLLSEGFWQRTKTSTVCSLAQVREKFGKHMFEQCLFEHQVEGCRARFRPRTDGVGVPPLFSQGGVAFLCSKSVGCLLERSRKIWKDLGAGYSEASDGWWAHSGGECES